MLCFFFSSRRRHTRCSRDWSSDVCSSDLSLPTHGDPPGQKTGGLRISWPASVLTRTTAKEMPAARGTAYASDKFEQVRFRAVPAARGGCHLGDRGRRDHPPPPIPPRQAEKH